MLPVLQPRSGRVARGCCVIVGLTILWAAPLLAESGFQRAGAAIGACERGAELAARKTGVPVRILKAIARTESGRKHDGRFAPWPWTVNVSGKGYWFDTFEQAEVFAREQLSAGRKSFDVGCFQINYRWHGARFKSLKDMFDPARNAQYAAEFLRELQQETGNWPEAAGTYHSRTPEFADRYRKRFERHFADLGVETVPPARPPATSAQPALAKSFNTYPLILNTRNDDTRLGSLVPLSGSSRPLITRLGDRG